LETNYKWRTGKDVDQIHSFLMESDKRNAVNGIVPKRNISSTQFFVQNSMVEVLQNTLGEIAAMYTLSLKPLFDTAVYQESEPDIKAAYLCRLCISPDTNNEEFLLGVRCIKRAIERAKEYDCKRLRCEINPDLEKVKKMLLLLDFELFTDQKGNGKNQSLKKAYMQKII
jgi:hypothetical protein